jgi:hypothetical protein
MMKKKLVAVFLLLATAMAFSQTSAQARGHHFQRTHHSVHHAAAARGQHRYERSAHHVSRRHVARMARIGGRPARWCGWWLGRQLGMPHRNLWLARNWASVGHNAGRPGIGVVVVWRHHVGIITGRAGAQWIVKSGNDGQTVRERIRSISGAIAFRHVGGGASI